MFRKDDIVEAVEDLETDDGAIAAGMRLVVDQISPQGMFLRPLWFNSFVRGDAFRKVGEIQRTERGFVAVPT